MRRTLSQTEQSLPESLQIEQCSHIVTVSSDVRVHSLIVPKMPDELVTLDSVLPTLAERQQIRRVQFKIWRDVKGNDMVHLDFLLASADIAARRFLQVSCSDVSPFSRTASAFRRFSLKSVDQVLNCVDHASLLLEWYIVEPMVLRLAILLIIRLLALVEHMPLLRDDLCLIALLPLLVFIGARLKLALNVNLRALA